MASADFCFVIIRSEHLYIRFKREFARELFGKEQFRFSLNLVNSHENKQLAESIATQINYDILAGKMEESFESYLPINQIKKNIGIFYNPDRIEISCQELFLKHAEFHSQFIEESTYKLHYIEHFYRVVKEGPQDLNKSVEIVDYLFKRCDSRTFLRIVRFLGKSIDWGKINNLIPPEAENSIGKILDTYTVKKGKYKPPAKFYDLIEGYVHDRSYRGFNSEEAKIVIDAFQKNAETKIRVFDEPQGGKKKYYKYTFTDADMASKANLSYLIQLLFRTGCRAGEAAALRWIDIDSDFKHVYFRNSYNAKLKKLKALKTEESQSNLAMNEARIFPCGDKLKETLENLKRLNNPTDKNDFLFQTKGGGVWHSNYVYCYWYGRSKRNYATGGFKFRQGIVFKLVIEGKIKQYLKPYACRHSWINRQLESGVPIATVAKYAGNSPQTILSNYVSFNPNIPLAPEV